MSYRAIAATNPRVKSVNYIEYVSGPSDSVVLIINHTIYIGRFPTMEAAEQAVEGLLVKCGCDNPTERRLLVPTDNRAIDYVPDVINWLNATTLLTTGTYGRTVKRITGTNRPIDIRLTRNNTNVDLWYRVSATDILGNGEPSADGYTLYTVGNLITVEPNYYLGFKGKPPGTIASAVSTIWTVINNSVTPNATLDTFTLTANNN